MGILQFVPCNGNDGAEAITLPLICWMKYIEKDRHESACPLPLTQYEFQGQHLSIQFIELENIIGPAAAANPTVELTPQAPDKEVTSAP